MQAKGGLNLVPIAVPDFYYLTSPSNSKKKFLRTYSGICNKSSVGIFDAAGSLSLFLNIFQPASWAILG